MTRAVDEREIELLRGDSNFMSEDSVYPGFVSEYDAPIPYMQRIRDYYQALGYGAPYRWAHYAEVPFQPLKKPLSECRVGLMTTAAPYQPGKGDQGPGAPTNRSHRTTIERDCPELLALCRDDGIHAAILVAN